eukprot:3885898-Rhodomonas_salina.2
MMRAGSDQLGPRSSGVEFDDHHQSQRTVPATQGQRRRSVSLSTQTQPSFCQTRASSLRACLPTSVSSEQTDSMHADA